jgi:hypothetical protein
MKKTGFLLFLLLLAFSSCKKAGSSTQERKAIIEFGHTKHDFGEIPFKGEGVVEFEFTNTGSDPLILTHVKSTCGCTIPEWSREPVREGGTGVIHVEYDTHRIGKFTKSIYVYSNAGNGPQKLMITGTVLRSET